MTCSGVQPRSVSYRHLEAFTLRGGAKRASLLSGHFEVLHPRELEQEAFVFG